MVWKSIDWAFEALPLPNPLLKGEGISIIEFMLVLNSQWMLPLPVGEGWGEGTNYILDFYCPATNLVIECDGSQNFIEEWMEADRIC